MTEEAHANVSTGPGVVGGYGQRPGVVDIKRSGIADDVVLLIVQTFTIVALILFALLVSAAAFTRWYWIVEQFIARNMIADMRAGVMYDLVVIVGFIVLCFVVVKLNPSRDIATFGVLLVIASGLMLPYVAFVAPLLVYVSRDWVVMGVTGAAIAMWLGVPFGIRAFRQKLIDPLSMEDSNTRVTLANNQHAIDMYLLRGVDENRKDQLILELQSELDAMREERDALRNRPAQIRLVTHNAGSAVGVTASEATFDPDILSMFITLGFPPSPRGVTRSAWVGDAAIREHGAAQCVGRDTWSRIVNALTAAGLTTIDHTGATRALMPADRALASFSPPLPPYSIPEAG